MEQRAMDDRRESGRSNHRFRPAVRPAIALVAVLGATLFGPTSPAFGQGGLYASVGRGELSDEEKTALGTLVNEFGFTDLAALWIDSRLPYAAASSRAELEWIREVDLRRANGEIDEADAANQALAKKYPNHSRAQSVELEAVITKVAGVLALYFQAQYETDSSTRARLISEADQAFRVEVLGELNSSIARLNAEVAQNPGIPAKAFSRDRWEHYRLKAIQTYARRLPDDTPAAKEQWEKLLGLALAFVDTRWDNFGFQYEAQLIVGQCYAALGRSEEAAQALEVIIEVEPVKDPPYDEESVRFIRWLRVQALQGSAEAWNRAGQPEKAVEIFDLIAEVPQPNFPWRMDPEDPQLLAFVVAMDVEEGIARLAGGVRQEGITRIRKLIARFDSELFRKGDPEAAESYLLDIAAGLARAVDIGVTDLPAEFYYRAALGFKSRGRFGDAIRAAQLALEAGGGVRGDEYWVAASLYQIGEGFDSIDLTESAALAFQTLVLQYLSMKGDPQFDVLLADASQNWFVLAGELSGTHGGAWRSIETLAQGVFGEVSRGSAGVDLRLQNASQEEGSSRYSKARDLYLGVPRTIEVDGKSERVDKYYRARAGAARCLFRKADSEGRAAEVLPALIAELSPLIDAARAEGDEAGEAALRFELANAHWDDAISDRAAAIAALTPLLREVRGKNAFREGALLLWVSVLAWGNPTDPSDVSRPREAEPVLNALRSDFGAGVSLAIALYDLVEAYQALGTPDDLKRAAELVLEYTRHPVAQFDEAGPGVKLTIAEILAEGGKPGEAAAILAKAREEAGDDAGLRVLILLSLAKSGNAAGRFREVFDSVDPYLKENEDDTYNGRYEEAPYLLYHRALADLGLREKDHDPDRLTRAEKDLGGATAILGQRRSSLIRQSALTPKFERDYWNCYLQYLLVLKIQDRCGTITDMIQGQRVMKGGGEFAPPAQQAKFDQLERECKE